MIPLPHIKSSFTPLKGIGREQKVDRGEDFTACGIARVQDKKAKGPAGLEMPYLDPRKTASPRLPNPIGYWRLEIAVVSKPSAITRLCA